MVCRKSISECTPCWTFNWKATAKNRKQTTVCIRSLHLNKKTKQCPISAATFVWWGHTLTQTTWKHEYMHPCINGDTRMHVFMLQGILRAPTEHHLNTSAYLSTAADHFYPFRVFMLWCFNLQYKVPWGDCEIYLKK